MRYEVVYCTHIEQNIQLNVTYNDHLVPLFLHLLLTYNTYIEQKNQLNVTYDDCLMLLFLLLLLAHQ